MTINHASKTKAVRPKAVNVFEIEVFDLFQEQLLFLVGQFVEADGKLLKTLLFLSLVFCTTRIDLLDLILLLH